MNWGRSTWATAYEYCYDTTNNNTCDGSWIDNGVNLSAFISGLNTGTTYYWQVKAKNSSGTVYADGSETVWWSFSTINLPGSFNKSSPTDGATLQPINPTLTWGASSEATSYEYCYDTTNDNTCTGWTSNGTSTNKSLSGLSINTTYYWQVRANNVGGTTYANTGTWWSFTTVPEITPPTVLSITRLDPTPTNATSIRFNVLFSEPVAGVDMVGPPFDDFILTTSPGISGASITSCEWFSATYTVTVNTGSGNGTIRLDVPVSATITDLVGNPLLDYPS